MADETGKRSPAFRVPPVETRFKAGQSGNPNGRPKKVQAGINIAQDNTEKALKKLAALIDNEDPRIALAAATAILDRSLGKPKQSVETTAKKEAADYSNAELLQIARMGSAGTPATQHGEREPDRIQ